ncbi:MAG: urease accessory protein UreE [Pseudomonadota bacterium]
MIRAAQTLPSSDPRLAETSRTLTLPRDQRHRRRILLTTDQGLEFLLDLPEATYLADGTGLLLEDGSVVRVVAAAEPLLEITAPDARRLTRIAWHIGNRHTPCEVGENALHIQPDHVLAEMVRGLGGAARAVSRPFEPEGGAYGGHGSLEHGHHHGGHPHAPQNHGHSHD